MNELASIQAPQCYLGKHGYEFDLFFSYSHGDVRGVGSAQLKSWSRQFYQMLGDALDSYPLRPLPRIFMDESPRPVDGLDKASPMATELLRKIRSSALLLSVMSPQYLASRWCQRELESFVAYLPDKSGSPERRILIAKALDTQKQDWPKPLCDDEGNKTMGWLFHKRDSAFPYGWMMDWNGSVPPAMHGEFMNMVQFIVDRLEKLNAELIEKEKKTELVDWLERGQVEKIYLYGRRDEEAEWEAVWKELEPLGIVVEPGEPEPLDADDDSAKRDRYAQLAARCDAMVLVGTDGLNLDFDLDVVGRERRHFIEAKYKKYLPCAVVDRHSLGRPARVANARRFGIDWIDTRACAWPDYIRTWLQDSAKKVREHYGLEAATS